MHATTIIAAAATTWLLLIGVVRGGDTSATVKPDLATPSGMSEYLQPLIENREKTSSGFVKAAQTATFQRVIQRVVEAIANGQCYVRMNASDAQFIKYMVDDAEKGESYYDQLAGRNSRLGIAHCWEFAPYAAPHYVTLLSWCGNMIQPYPPHCYQLEWLTLPYGAFWPILVSIAAVAFIAAIVQFRFR